MGRTTAEGGPEPERFPIIVMGTDYWREMLDFLEKMAAAGMINPEDVRLVFVTDSGEATIAHLREQAIVPFGLKPVRQPSRWLGEFSWRTSAR